MDSYHEYCTGGFHPDDIVITGIAGRFPCSDNVGELKDGIFNQKNFFEVSNLRWEKGACGSPHGSYGNIQTADKMDADFFRLVFPTANSMSPENRQLLEVTYECIVDSGYDPDTLRGSQVGVYSANISGDAHQLLLEEKKADINGYLRCFLANRSSYAFDFRGPSFTVDSACSSSGTALWNAYKDLKDGSVVGALVSASQLDLDPRLQAIYRAKNLTTPSGSSVPFDASSDGISRTEGVVALFLQKASAARRVYATLLSAKTHTSGFVPEGISVPSHSMQVQTSLEGLQETGLTADDIEYMEAHGTGTAVGDPIEVGAIAEALCQNRKKPLLITSIKSCIGHTEASSALCSVINVIIAYETGMIAPNFKFKTPNPNIPAILDGRIRVVTEPTPLTKPHVLVNSFGFGGGIAQMILKRNPIVHSGGKTKHTELPRLVLYPATTEEAVSTVMDYVQNTPDLQEGFFALMNQLSHTTTVSKPFRGFGFFHEKNEPVTEIKSCNPHKKEVWFIMTGMGCQWNGMGIQMMQVESFARSMKKSAEYLKPFGFDLLSAMKPNSKEMQNETDSTLSFCAITAIQIAFVDVLRELGIEPDGIAGHSAGEMVAAYADGSCTLEQTIVSSFSRSQSCNLKVETAGAMAAIGLSWEEAVKRCPEGVYVGCDNADDNVTITGYKEPVEKFVDELQKDKIFARNVSSYSMGFHCKLVEPASQSMLKSLKKLYPKPQPRTSRWISTSYPESSWNDPGCKVAGAEYFVHNMTHPVLFREAMKRVPKDAITIELGPHALLRAILKRTVGTEATHVSLMKRNEPDNIGFFFKSLGQLYTAGLDPKIERLYPPVKFPVPRGTPMISDLIRWNHSLSFHVAKWSPTTGESHYEFHLDSKDSYLLDHFIDGRSLFPAAGYIFLAWRAVAEKLLKTIDELPVIIENFKIHKATIINQNANVKFYVNILGNSGNFEITEGNSLVASGHVSEWKSPVFTEPMPCNTYKATDAISGAEVYNELKMNNYEYGPAFRGLLEINDDATQGMVDWKDKWIPFMDSLLLFFGMITNNAEFKLPTGLLSVKLNAEELRRTVGESNSSRTTSLPVSYNRDLGICRTAGVEITKLNLDPAPHRPKEVNPTFEEYKFIPYTTNYTSEGLSNPDIYSYMHVCNNVIDEIGKTSGMDVSRYKFAVEIASPDNKFEKNENIDAGCVLLQVLKSLSTNRDSRREIKKELFTNYSQNLGNDILNQDVVNEKVLRVITEIVSENSFRKLNVSEVNRNFPLILPTLRKIVQNYSFVRFKKAVLVTSEDTKPDSQLLSESDIELTSMNVLKSEGKNQDLVISSFIGGSLRDLEHLLSSLSGLIKDNGFILFYHKEEMLSPEKLLCSLCDGQFQFQTPIALDRVLFDHKLITVAKMFNSNGGSLYLLRAILPISPYAILNVTDDGLYSWVEKLKDLLANTTEKIWLTSVANPSNGIVGMMNCLKQEPGGERVRCIFMPQAKCDNKSKAFSFEQPHCKDLLEKDLVMNILQEETWGSFKHFSMNQNKDPKKVDYSFVSCRKYGDLSSFEWMESNISCSDENEKKLVHIYYSALNFKDVMLASGKLSTATSKLDDEPQVDDSVLGLEFSGRDSLGQRVAGFVPCRGMATSTLVRPLACINIPNSWTLEEAATVPVVYATCYYALIIRGQLKTGESVLIHSATGGIGLAAINIAMSLNCEIFATVGNDEKHQFLKKKFPGIPDENIGCSRNTSFEQMILNRTSGKGVNLVLNSLADEKFIASVRCVSQNGRFVEIGKYDLSLDRALGLKVFLKNISFHGVFLDALFVNNSYTREILKDVMKHVKEGIANGIVQPLERTVFARDQVEDAFRYMAKGVHVGKVLLKIRDEEPTRHAIASPLVLPAVPNTYFYPNKVYIVVGGFGGFGIEVTKWVLSRGAKIVVLTSRTDLRTPYHALCLMRWKKAGYNIQESTLNVANKNEAERLLKQVAAIGPIGGIINSAVVLKDAFMDCQSARAYDEVCAPKATASKNLDELSRKLCPSLDHFICFSSISCGRGNAGQTNYGYANSVMERICEERRKIGLPGLAIQWGIIGEVGVVHRHMGDDAHIAGVCAQSVSSCLGALDLFCQQGGAVVSSYVAVAQAQGKKTSQSTDVFTQIAKVFGLKDISNVNTHLSFGEMGFDSIVGVELKLLLENIFDASLTMQEIQDMKISDVKAMVETIKTDTSRASKSKTLVTTVPVKMPEILNSKDPVLAINKESKGNPVVIVSVGNIDPQDFKVFAECLSKPVFVLMWSKDTPSSSLSETASSFLKIVQSKIGRPFHLVGYGTHGGSLAFEMTSQNSKSKTTVKSLTLLEGSSHLINSLSKGTQPKDLEVDALCGFVEQFIPEGVPEMEEELLKLGNLDLRTNFVLDFLTRSSSDTLNTKEVTDAISSYILKSRLVQSYIPKKNISQDLVLVEDPDKLLANDISEVKQTLSQICAGKIVIHRVFSRSELVDKEAVQRLTDILKSVIN